MPGMKPKHSRRDFLRTLTSGFAGAAAMSILPLSKMESPPCLGRVTSESLSVYQQPSDKSRILFQRFRDDILNIYSSLQSPDGPGYNPLWHRVWGGYVHSAFVQDVRNQLNPVQQEFPSSGQLMELTVPYSQSYRVRSNGKWESFYRLYYSSTHWVSSVREGPDGNLWYQVNNPLLTLSYYVSAEHLRPVSAAELAPIHPELDPREKSIEISIDFQRLRAFEGDNQVKECQVSTGLPFTSINPEDIPTDTPKGDHLIRSKNPSVHMGDGTLRSDAEAYELPGVPWVLYFEMRGYALHGAYWHNNFGMTMSHGCVNMRSQDAKWLYRWCTPSTQDATSIKVHHISVRVV